MYLYGGFACDVCDQEVHGNVLAVHMSVHPVLNVSGHLVRVQIIEVLEQKQGITGVIHRRVTETEAKIFPNVITKSDFLEL